MGTSENFMVAGEELCVRLKGRMGEEENKSISRHECTRAARMQCSALGVRGPPPE